MSRELYVIPIWRGFAQSDDEYRGEFIGQTLTSDFGLSVPPVTSVECGGDAIQVCVPFDDWFDDDLLADQAALQDMQQAICESLSPSDLQAIHPSWRDYPTESTFTRYVLDRAVCRFDQNPQLVLDAPANGSGTATVPVFTDSLACIPSGPFEYEGFCDADQCPLEDGGTGTGTGTGTDGGLLPSVDCSDWDRSQFTLVESPEANGFTPRALTLGQDLADALRANSAIVSECGEFSVDPRTPPKTFGYGRGAILGSSAGIAEGDEIRLVCDKNEVCTSDALEMYDIVSHELHDPTGGTVYATVKRPAAGRNPSYTFSYTITIPAP